MYKTLSIEKLENNVFHVQLNRPNEFNSMNKVFWKEFKACFQSIYDNRLCKCVVGKSYLLRFFALQDLFFKVSALGKHFSVGLALNDFESFGEDSIRRDTARKALSLKRTISNMQDAFTIMEVCKNI